MTGVAVGLAQPEEIDALVAIDDDACEILRHPRDVLAAPDQRIAMACACAGGLTPLESRRRP